MAPPLPSAFSKESLAFFRGSPIHPQKMALPLGNNNK
jgi:hypothetical protein